MGILTNRFIKTLLGIMLLCVFTVRPCVAFVRHVSALKNLPALEKGLEDTSKEDKEGKESKSRDTPVYELPASAGEKTIPAAVRSRRQAVIWDVPGCSGPIMQIQTPPPDGAYRF